MEGTLRKVPQDQTMDLIPCKGIDFSELKPWIGGRAGRDMVVL